MRRHVTVEHDYTDDEDTAHHMVLECDITDATAGDRFEAPYPGDIEAKSLRVDGEPITDLTGWQWLIDAALSKPIPKPEEDHGA